jgi:hypothetical protein
MTLRDLIALSLSSVPLRARSLALRGLAETASPELAAIDLEALLEWGGSTERADELRERAGAFLTRAERRASTRFRGSIPDIQASSPRFPTLRPYSGHSALRMFSRDERWQSWGHALRRRVGWRSRGSSLSIWLAPE